MEAQKSFFVTDWLDKRARLTPERTALLDTLTDEEISFAAWNARVNQTANFLYSLGVRKGDRISVYASNCAEYLDLFFACNKTGAILHNLNWRLTVAELQNIIAEAGPKILIYSPEWQPSVTKLKSKLTTVKHMVAIGDSQLEMA
ncbi:MAG: AMP-binding protein, partial [bacterium]